MSDPERNKKLFDRVFERTKDDPEDWGSMAWTLMTASDVLLEAFGQTWDGPTGEPVHPENERLDHPASMLYGCAMENMIKGYLVRKYGGFEKARDKYRPAWDRHQISRLAEATGLPLTTEQKLILGSLEAFIVWAGRYPISMKPETYTIEKQFRSGDHMTPNTIGCDSIAILKPFYKQLEDYVFTDLRKNLGDLELTKLS